MNKIEKKSVYLGIDVGIASVGLTVVDTDFNIIERITRLFNSVDEIDGLKNVTRREKRGARRQRSRRTNLKIDFIKLLVKHDIFDQQIDKEGIFQKMFLETFINPSLDVLQTRVDGLNSPLQKNILIQVLYWYLAHRGYQYTVVDDKEFEDAKKKYPNMDFSKHPCELQMDFMKQNGYVYSSFNRLFSTKRYLNELKTILKNDDSLSEEFKNDYLDLFQRRRSFEEGPGLKDGYLSDKFKHLDLKSVVSPFSRHYVFDSDNNIQEAYPNIWNKTIGFCSLFNEKGNEKYRAPLKSITAQVFNLLNSLNFVTIIGHGKLSYEDKIEILKISFKTEKNTKGILEYLIKKYNLEPEWIDKSIEGFGNKPKEKTKSKTKQSQELWKYEIGQLNTIHLVNKILPDDNQITFENSFDFNSNHFNFDLIDKHIVALLSDYKEIEKRSDKLKILFEQHSVFDVNNKEETINKLANINIGSGRHSFSYEAMELMIPLLLETNDEQGKLTYEYKNNRSNHKTPTLNRKYIPVSWIDELIASPTMKRALKQTLNTLNDLIRYRDYNVEGIAIEMPRDTNSQMEKDSIYAKNKNAKLNNQNLLNLAGYDASLENKVEWTNENTNEVAKSLGFKGNWKEKLWLFEQQERRDAYTGELLDKKKVLSDPNYTDIDHIIPYSQCFDNSRSNKVLTTSIENSKKGNKQPFQYLSQSSFKKMQGLWDKWYDSNVFKRQIYYDPKKLKNLYSNIDYSNPINSYGFIGKNLADTRYIAKETFSVLKDFIESCSDDHMFKLAKLVPINGKITNFLRHQIDNPKNGWLKRPSEFEDGSFDTTTLKKKRDWNGHHTEDAAIIVWAAFQNKHLLKITEKLINHPYISDEDVKSWFDNQNDVSSWNKKIDITKLKNELNRTHNNVKYSYMIKTKTNTKISNETLYEGKLISNSDKPDEIQQIYSLDLLDKDNQLEFKKLFGNDEKENKKLILYNEDPVLFECLKEVFIASDYSFIKYNQDNGNELNKYVLISKEINGKRVEWRVKRVRVYGAKKQLNDVVWSKEKNKYSFMTGLEWLEIHIFRFKNQDGEEKTSIIKVNPLLVKKLGSKKLEYNEKYYEKLRSIQSEREIVSKINDDLGHSNIILHKYSTLQDKDGNLWKVVGGNEDKNYIEVQRLDGLKIKIRDMKSPNITKTENMTLLGWKVVDLNYLGEIKRILYTF